MVKQVGHDLTRVLAIGERVDHRDRGRGRHPHQALGAEGAEHDRVGVARQHPRGVLDRLAAGELGAVAGQDRDLAAQLAHRDLEADPGPGRGLLHDDRDVPPGQPWRRRVGPRRLPRRAGVDERGQPIAIEIAQRDEVGHGASSRARARIATASSSSPVLTR
jgi:hypothetical protein